MTKVQSDMQYIDNTKQSNCLNTNSFTKSTVWLIKRFKKEACMAMINAYKYKLSQAFSKWAEVGINKMNLVIFS